MKLSRMVVASLAVLGACSKPEQAAESDCSAPALVEAYGGTARVFAPGVDTSGLAALKTEQDTLCRDGELSLADIQYLNSKLEAIAFDTAQLRLEEQAAADDSLDALLLVYWMTEDPEMGFPASDDLQPNPIRTVAVAVNGKNAVIRLTREERSYPVPALTWKDRCGLWHWALRIPDPRTTDPSRLVRHYTEKEWKVSCSDFAADRKRLLQFAEEDPRT